MKIKATMSRNSQTQTSTKEDLWRVWVECEGTVGECKKVLDNLDLLASKRRPKIEKQKEKK